MGNWWWVVQTGVPLLDKGACTVLQICMKAWLKTIYFPLQKLGFRASRYAKCLIKIYMFQRQENYPIILYLSSFGLDPCVYTICIRKWSAPFTNPDWTHKLQDSIICFPKCNNICFSSWWESSYFAFEPLVKSMIYRVIGIANAWSVYLLWLSARLFARKRLIDVSNI